MINCNSVTEGVLQMLNYAGLGKKIVYSMIFSICSYDRVNGLESQSSVVPPAMDLKLNTYHFCGTVKTLICISLIRSPLMVVESQESVISLPLYIISPTCNHLILQVHMLNNLPYKVQREQ